MDYMRYNGKWRKKLTKVKTKRGCKFLSNLKYKKKSSRGVHFEVLNTNRSNSDMGWEVNINRKTRFGNTRGLWLKWFMHCDTKFQVCFGGL